MCRNIRQLHNFQPPATSDEVRAAALQYVRKVSGSTKPSQANQAAFDEAVEEVSAHILKFWEPRMRAKLRRRVITDDSGIEHILAEAVRAWPDEEETQADRDIPSGG